MDENGQCSGNEWWHGFNCATETLRHPNATHILPEEARSRHLSVVLVLLDHPGTGAYTLENVSRTGMRPGAAMSICRSISCDKHRTAVETSTITGATQLLLISAWGIFLQHLVRIVGASQNCGSFACLKKARQDRPGSPRRFGLPRFGSPLWSQINLPWCFHTNFQWQTKSTETQIMPKAVLNGPQIHTK